MHRLLPLVTALVLSAAPSWAAKKRVVTTFTIIAEMAQNVAGDKATVTSITKPGAEIHGYEPTPGDIVKALTLAQAVICGGVLAGCAEAPGDILEIGGKLFKQYRGMGSLAAMKAGSAARYGHSTADATRKVAAEGVEALKEVSGPLERTLAQLIGGIQSGMGYLGAANLAELRKRARYIRVTAAGVKEAGAHDVVEVKTGN